MHAALFQILLNHLERNTALKLFKKLILEIEPDIWLKMIRNHLEMTFRSLQLDLRINIFRLPFESHYLNKIPYVDLMGGFF